MMHTWQNKIVALLCGVLSTAFFAGAQTGSSLGTSTPYSLYGLGDFAAQGASTQLGMGGIQMGIRDTRSIDFTNPAGASARDSLVFVIDLGGEMRNIYSTSSTAKTSFNSANFRHVAIAFPMGGTRWGLNLGLVPYTRVGYEMELRATDADIVNGAGDVRYQYRGEDGLSQMFLNLGYTPIRQLSVGVGVKYYFGTINRYYNTLFANTPFLQTYSQSSLKVSDVSFTLGMHYIGRLSSRHRLVAGLTVAPPTNISTTETIIATNYSTAQSTVIYVDTAYNKGSGSSTFKMPLQLNVGLSLAQTDKWLLGADLALSDWSKTEIAGRKNEMGLGYDVKLGGAFTPDRYSVRYYTSRITYRAGLRYSQSPLRYNGQSVMEKAATIGMCFPLKGIGDLNFSAEYMHRSLPNNKGVQENCFNFSFSLTLFEYWFMKYQYE
ncbi:hypothetical protein FACS1894156_6310 [Bacteroidia bacterium]|nr:hypothetical protein FACS1894156_6310 [Bacteroidia bacterium]